MWTVQARRFAQRENYTDAVARMGLVARSIEGALANVTDTSDRKELQMLLARANERLEELRASYEEWRSAIAERRQETINNAAEDMARPIPPNPE